MNIPTWCEEHIKLRTDLPNVRDLVQKMPWTNLDDTEGRHLLRCDLGIDPALNTIDLEALARATLDFIALLLDLHGRSSIQSQTDVCLPATSSTLENPRNPKSVKTSQSPPNFASFGFSPLGTS